MNRHSCTSFRQLHHNWCGDAWIYLRYDIYNLKKKKFVANFGYCDVNLVETLSLGGYEMVNGPALTKKRFTPRLAVDNINLISIEWVSLIGFDRSVYLSNLLMFTDCFLVIITRALLFRFWVDFITDVIVSFTKDQRRKKARLPT